MTEEQQSSETSVTNPNPTSTPHSNEATIHSTAHGGNSTCNNVVGGEASGISSENDAKNKDLELSDELMEKGSKAVNDDDLDQALDCFSRALEIRVAYYGELAPECVSAYYKYGCALLYKAQDEADPLGAMPKKEVGSKQDSDKGDSVKKTTNGESSVTSVASNAGQDDGQARQEGAEDAATGGKDEEEDGENHDDDDDDEEEEEELNEADEEESDLDAAWKMLDIARVIVDKQSGETKEKLDILSKLAEVSMEREEFETALADYKKALSILEQVAEPDYRHLTELNFRICLCLELGSNADEAILYCKKATSLCKSRLDQIKSEIENMSEPALSSDVEELDKGVQQSANTDGMVERRKKELETLAALLIDLERKLEDLQQLASNPKSILSEILGIASAKAKGNENSAIAAMGSSQMATANSSGSFDSPTASTAHTDGASAVTHLGVVGRGVKRMHMNSGTDGSIAAKKPALDSDKGDGNAA